mmetsp:Transcript_6662/g.19498  ORF Transcript_6662/g.19498 Transcript_6662/m.19498 type:complete len:991 (+) Transcript_6662:320-3292(+)
MSVLTDVETSAEALQEEEELIEAVEQLVQTAAVAIYEDIRNDVDSMVHRTGAFINTIFPFLARWRSTHGLFWTDLRRFIMTIMLGALVYHVVGWFKRRSQQKSWKLRSGRHRRVASFHGMRFHSSSTEPYLRTRTYSDGDEHVVAHSLISGGFSEDEETDEEKFRRNWPSIMHSEYSKLVLPPHCKLVEKPKQQRKKDKDAANAEKSSTGNKHGEKDEIEDEDHPVNRLVNYMRHFMLLVVSFLKYDYMAAGGFIMNWLQACLKRREHHGGSGDADDQEEDFEDDESDVASTHTNALKRSSASHGSKTAPTRGIRPKAMKSPRSKRDTVSSKLGTFSTDENDTMDMKINCSLDSISILSDAYTEAEEKKDSSTDEHRHTKNTNGTVTPPTTPTLIGKAKTPPSLNSLYQTPSAEDSAHHRSLLGEKVAARLIIPPRNTHMPNLKTKDALQHYRGKKSIKPSAVVREEPDEGISTERPSLTDHRDSSGYYFEAVSTNNSLKRMAVEVPVPDKNGYIIGDEFLPDPSYSPLLVFVNSRSGAQQGHLLINQMRRLLNPIQVWDLAEGGPETVIESFSCFTRLRILVCGGDGTVSWVVSSIESMELPRWPPIAILPLGTGNDLARIHGWGGGYNNESLIDILEQVSESYVSWLDRWEMTVENKKGKVKSTKSFFNYLGVGADAQAALQVHMLRESRPQLFFSRLVNKLWYGVFGAEDAIKATSLNLPHEIKLYADGVEVPLPPDSQGIIMLNIDSYTGGVPIWSTATKRQPQHQQHQQQQGCRRSQFKRSLSLGSISSSTKRSTLEHTDSVEDFRFLTNLSDEERYQHVTACDRPSSCQDGLLDIVSIRGTFHLGQIRVGISNADRLCQCREARIVIKKKVPVQIDGEPWRQNVCTLRVRRKKDAAIMLHRSAYESIGVETEMANLLDWAQEKSYIDDTVHAAMMKEFSRRIETKTRQRRVVRSQDNIMFSLKRAIGSSGNFQPNKKKEKPVMF